jgi:hypothetical protein
MEPLVVRVLLVHRGGVVLFGCVCSIPCTIAWQGLASGVSNHRVGLFVLGRLPCPGVLSVR